MNIEAKHIRSFHEKVDRNGPFPDQSNPHYQGLSNCWQWTGKLNESGYGRLHFTPLGTGKRISIRAHRIAWMIAHGTIADGMLVLHKCDNRACVNPDHLFLGTAKDNSLDCMRKGRREYPKGVNRVPRKPRKWTTPRILTESQVDEIRGMRGMGLSCQKIASKFNVSRSMIWLIVTGKSWFRPCARLQSEAIS